MYAFQSLIELMIRTAYKMPTDLLKCKTQLQMIDAIPSSLSEVDSRSSAAVNTVFPPEAHFYLTLSN